MDKCIAACVAFAALLAIASPSSGDMIDDFTPHWYTDGESDTTLPFQLFKPLDYDQNPDKDYPLILYLHASGQSGTNNTSQFTYGIANVYSHAATTEHSAFILAPQTDQGWSYYDQPGNKTRITLDVIDLLEEYYRIDPRRVYVTGISMGGYGAWDLVGKLPNRFAAAVPIAGGGDPSKAINMVNQPVWAFHGALDENVSVEQDREMIAAIQAVGGSPHYTEYPDYGHSIWGYAYKTEPMWDWMFSQTLPPGSAPNASANSYFLNEDEAVVVDASRGILGNDSDPDGDTLTAIARSAPEHGTLSLDADGSFTYTPDADYYGTDGFTYQAYDGYLRTPITTVTFNVAPVNDPPATGADDFSVEQGQQLIVYDYEGLLVNDDDVETPEALSAVLDSDVSNGTLSLSATGAFTYEPAVGFFGQDGFTYRAFDGEAYSESTSVVIHVLSILKVPGDANRDGRVDDQDAAILAQYWGQPEASWAMGDFDGDGTIGMGDASLLAANWGYVAGGIGEAVPEPASAGLLVLGLLATLGAGRATSRRKG